jgi:hypothetical protein
VNHLKALQAIAVLSLPSRDVQHAIDQLSAFRVMAARPVVASSTSAHHEAVGIEQSTDGAATDLIQRGALKIDKHRAWNENFSRAALVVNVESLVGKDAVAIEMTATIDVVLVGNYFPKLPWKHKRISGLKQRRNFFLFTFSPTLFPQFPT